MLLVCTMYPVFSYRIPVITSTIYYILITYIKNILKFVSAEPKMSMVIYRTPVILQQQYDPNHNSSSIIRNYPPPPPYEMATKMPKVEVT